MVETVQRSSDLRVPGATIHVVCVGLEEAPPLLVLHGGPGEAHDYLRPHLDRLASERRRVVYFDQRGGGRSTLDPGERPAGFLGHVDDIDAVRRHVGGGRVDVLGFSWGGLLAILYALQHPEGVARLILVSPAPIRSLTGDAGARAEEKAKSRPEVAALQARLAPIAGDTSDPGAARRARFALKIAPWLFDPERALDIEPVDARDDVAAAVARSLATFDLRPNVESLRGVPSIVVRGADDPVPEASAAETATLLGARLVVLPRCGHAPFVEVPGAFLEAVTAFLDDNEPPGGAPDPAAVP